MAKEKIIIVEDELAYVALLSSMLENLGFEVIGFYSSGEEAIKNIKENKPDCILMDIELSDKMDGISAAVIITKENNIPIIFLTSETNAKQMKLAAEVSPFGYLIKPVNPEDLNLTIKSAIQRSHLEAIAKTARD